MELVKAIIDRHSVRDFKSDPIPKATILKILETAVHAPSAGNSQPWNIYVAAGAVAEKIRQTYVERFEKGIAGKSEMSGTPPPMMPKVMSDRMAVMRNERMKLLGLDPADPASHKATMAAAASLYGAPVLIILTMDKTLDKWSVYDLGLLSQNICLCAQASGLGTLIAMAYVSQPDILRAELGIPNDQVIVTGIGLGYISKNIINSYVSSRRPIAETVTLKGF